MKLFLNFLFALLIIAPVKQLKAELNPEKDILSSALKIYQSISSQDDIKTRLRKQELVINKIDEILDVYGGTDTGLELLSTGTFGKFQIQKVRDKYIKERIEFSLKTCESNPTFDCLAFISLDNGIKQCENSGSYSSFLSASNNFKNAYSIFKVQQNSSSYDIVVLSAYRKCSNLAKSDFGRDFINSRLVNLLFKNGDESKAIGLIQNMKTPLFKVLAAADLRVNQGKYDESTYLKLVEKSKEFDSTLDKESAILTLSNKLFDVGLSPFVANASLGWIDTRKVNYCDGEKGEYIGELAMDFLFKRAKANPGFDFNNSENIVDRSSVCGKYKVQTILYFLRENDLETASSIRIHQATKGTDSDLLVDHLKTVLPAEEFFRMYIISDNKFKKRISNSMNTSEINSFERKILYPFDTLYGKNKIFKTAIDIEEVCKASEILFQKLRGSKYEAQAVSHFISSPLISSDKKYSCGDADLDLLIN